jgi:hypothetical protein
MGLFVRGLFFLIGVIALIQSAAIVFGGLAEGTRPGVILALFGLMMGLFSLLFMWALRKPFWRSKKAAGSGPGSG